MVRELSKGSPVERIELYERLLKISDHEDTIFGIISNAAHKEDTEYLIDFIDKGDKVFVSNLLFLSAWLLHNRNNPNNRIEEIELFDEDD